MENITRTIYGAKLQSSLLLNKPVIIDTNSTLNEKFSIQANVALGTNDKPAMNYVAVGNGGHRFVTGSNGRGRPVPIQHNPTDAALYNQLPFVLRTLDNDLDSIQKQKYGLRRVETYNAVQYVAYYLKRLDLSTTVPEIKYSAVVNGSTTTTPFTPTTSNLNPTPPDVNVNGVNITTGDYVSTSSRVPFVLTTDDITELMNVANIIEGDSNFAIISEIATCSGLDKVVQVTSPGQGTFNFNEVIAVQVASFISTNFYLPSTNAGLSLLLDVGATEPMMVLTSG